jgi:ankyrin repeat protein
MSIKLTPEEVSELQSRYRYLTNYESEDPEDPIDPSTYVDSNGDKLLHIAAYAGDLQSVCLLLKAGVNVNDVGDMGCTALHYARTQGHAELVRLLLDSGARTDVENDFGQLP